jgi:transcriptional regulator with XRE-family HTH domain
MADLLKDRIAIRIKELRTERQLTQEEVARLVGVSTRHYVRWERGTSLPYWRNVERLAEAFEVEPGAIVDAEDSSITGQDPKTRIAALTREVAALEQKVESLTRLLEAQSGRKTPS